jgi:hypothetical protein
VSSGGAASGASVAAVGGASVGGAADKKTPAAVPEDAAQCGARASR